VVSLFDWNASRPGAGETRKRKRESLPPAEHIAIGVPSQEMVTARKIMTANGQIYRGGGFYSQHVPLCILVQV
jgi:hypothetical protein